MILYFIYRNMLSKIHSNFLLNVYKFDVKYFSTKSYWKPLCFAFIYDIFIVPNQTNVNFIQKKGDYNDSNTR